jgi:hypothetical protein
MSLRAASRLSQASSIVTRGNGPKEIDVSSRSTGLVYFILHRSEPTGLVLMWRYSLDELCVGLGSKTMASIEHSHGSASRRRAGFWGPVLRGFSRR